MKYAVKSDRGKIRELNEDSYNIIESCSSVPVSFIIADGMGGHNSGEIASRLAVEFASDYILNSPGVLSKQDNILSDIECVMRKANDGVYLNSKENEINQGMGTTLIIAVADSKNLYIGHVGDSRVYLIRNGLIERITTDHSYTEELVKSGTLTREEAETHPKKNIITRALGCSDDLLIDTYVCSMEKDDFFILCTDGLTSKLNDNEIKDIVIEFDDPELACKKLIDAANEKGGEDNTTVIVIKND